MAAVVAHQHAGLWHQRPEHSFHVPELHFTGMMPAYNAQRSAATTSSVRSFQPPPTTHMDISLPLFTANGLPTSVPYQPSGPFAYDSSVNPYNMQQGSMPQSYAMNYSSSMAPAVSYAGRSDVQTLPTVRDARHAFGLEGDHMVKSESASPVQSSPMYNNGSYAADCKRCSSEPVETTNINFATDVDTLMRAIQAKQTTSPQKISVAKVSTHHEQPSTFVLYLRSAG
jgi:hypothetical protein